MPCLCLKWFLGHYYLQYQVKTIQNGIEFPLGYGFCPLPQPHLSPYRNSAHSLVILNDTIIPVTSQSLMAMCSHCLESHPTRLFITKQSSELGSNTSLLITPLVKNLPEMQETLVQLLGQEVSLEEGMASFSSILAWRIPMDREAWRAAVLGVTENQT